MHARSSCAKLDRFSLTACSVYRTIYSPHNCSRPIALNSEEAPHAPASGVSEVCHDSAYWRDLEMNARVSANRLSKRQNIRSELSWRNETTPWTI